MILLDTNIVSEMMRATPDPHVARWIDGFSGMRGLALCSITVQEIEYGLRRLPAGRRRHQLEFAWRDTLDVFAGTIVPFDDHAALRAAELLVRANRAGRAMSMGDVQIAGICLTQGLALATRNVKDFTVAEELRIVDPFSSPCD